MLSTLYYDVSQSFHFLNPYYKRNKQQQNQTKNSEPKNRNSNKEQYSHKTEYSLNL